MIGQSILQSCTDLKPPAVSKNEDRMRFLLLLRELTWSWRCPGGDLEEVFRGGDLGLSGERPQDQSGGNGRCRQERLDHLGPLSRR